MTVDLPFRPELSRSLSKKKKKKQIQIWFLLKQQMVPLLNCFHPPSVPEKKKKKTVLKVSSGERDGYPSASRHHHGNATASLQGSIASAAVNGYCMCNRICFL